MAIPPRPIVNSPKMIKIRQIFDIPEPIAVDERVDGEFARVKDRFGIARGASVAVGVGSRGIDQLAPVVRRVIQNLRDAGAEPFVMPAMGSHGGATAEGQIEVLAERGITEESVGAPVRASMEVVPQGQTDDGIPLFLSRFAHEADAICLINRVKPHTNFVGPTESGLLKMMAIGLGNQAGAEHYHRLSLARDQYSILSSAGRTLIKQRGQKFLGVALVENQEHRLCRLEMAVGEDVEPMETRLMLDARSFLPGLPVDQIDLLIVDEMGKDISGEGIDPNVVGRDCCAYGAKRPSPRITRIFVRDLTPGSKGSALGIGQADFTLKRLVDKIDFQATAVNCLTACCPEAARIPMTFERDDEAIATALATIRPYTREDLGIVHIKNTLALETVMVSEAYKPLLEQNEAVEMLPGEEELAFDGDGFLVSPFTSSHSI